jgi:hypothetical protein
MTASLWRFRALNYRSMAASFRTLDWTGTDGTLITLYEFWADRCDAEASRLEAAA